MRATPRAPVGGDAGRVDEVAPPLVPLLGRGDFGEKCAVGTRRVGAIHQQVHDGIDAVEAVATYTAMRLTRSGALKVGGGRIDGGAPGGAGVGQAPQQCLGRSAATRGGVEAGEQGDEQPHR